jgi:hypothetical protein
MATARPECKLHRPNCLMCCFIRLLRDAALA